MDNSAFSRDEDYSGTFVNTPSVEKQRNIDFFFMKISLLAIIFAVGFWGSFSRFLAFQVFGTNTIDIWDKMCRKNSDQIDV